MQNDPLPKSQIEVDAFLAGWDAAVYKSNADPLLSANSRAAALRQYDPAGQPIAPEELEPFDGAPDMENTIEAGVEAAKTGGYSRTQLPGTGPDGERLI